MDLLVQAAGLVKPVALIAPDWEDAATETIVAAYKLTVASKNQPWTIGALVQGKNLKERVACFLELQDRLECRPIGFPFRSPRDKTIAYLADAGALRESGWYHLFGLRDNKELKWKLPGRWSMDTGKPFKGFFMDKEPIRGHGRLQLHEPLAIHDKTIALYNIAWMRKQIGGKE